MTITHGSLSSAIAARSYRSVGLRPVRVVQMALELATCASRRPKAGLGLGLGLGRVKGRARARARARARCRYSEIAANAKRPAPEPVPAPELLTFVRGAVQMEWNLATVR